MKILNGWKEIAECLSATPRTAQRWERLGLPVRRVSTSRRSPIVATSEEIENWIREKRTRFENGSIQESAIAFRTTRRETQKLVVELKAARVEQRKMIDALRRRMHESQALSSKLLRERL